MSELGPIDLLVVGAGPTGCVISERAAHELGWKVLLVDRRPHVGGNCHDTTHAEGVLIHKYGPHYFRTDSDALLEYLSRFTAWIPGNYVVKVSTRGELFPFPINLSTLEQFFRRQFTPETARSFLEGLRVPIETPRNSEEYVLSRVGRELYEAFYLGYTRKQWGRHPRELAPSVCGRIPIRFDRDSRYVDARHQVMPAEGFTRLFSRMIDQPSIQLRLNTDFRELRNVVQPRFGVVYSGPIDEYFEHRFGRLDWRSLRFELVASPQEYVQPCVQINHPDDFEYTRSVEIKHVTGQRHPSTVISYEYPSASEPEPYYPIPAAGSVARHEQYRELAEHEEATRKVFFAGRLATYRYINTDEAILEALATFERIRRAAGREAP